MGGVSYPYHLPLDYPSCAYALDPALCCLLRNTQLATAGVLFRLGRVYRAGAGDHSWEQ